MHFTFNYEAHFYVVFMIDLSQFSRSVFIMVLLLLRVQTFLSFEHRVKKVNGSASIEDQVVPPPHVFC